jgi:Kef-type K+ transport system membrane component KefB
MPLLIAALLVVAIGGKVLGGLLGALGSGGFMRPLMIGVGMVPRGEVALVIAGLGFEQAHISHHMLVALVLMTIGAALVGPLLLTPLLHIHERRIDQ